MRRLLLATLLAPVTALAGVLATINNDGGGKIVLTDMKCKAVENALVAYATNPKGSTLTGCWTLDENFVHILWDDDGKIRSYELHLWEVSKRRGGGA